MVTEAIATPLTQQYYEDYAHQNFKLNDGQYSPDKTHYCRYTGFGTVKTDTQLGTKVLSMKPAPPSGNATTRACSVVITKDVKNFEWEVRMATLSQTSPQQNNWETAWLFFHQTDQSHHYACYIQKDGDIEVSKKDMETWEERQIFLKTTNKPNSPGFEFKKWYNIKIRMEGFRIQVWVNGKQYVDIVDDGTIGNFGKLPDGTPRPRHPPSEQMSHGLCGYYCEDSWAVFDRSRITPLP